MNNAISVDPDVCNGKPVFRGTRITVQTIFEFLSAGDSMEDVLKHYPSLKRSDIEAAFAYASRLTGNRYTTEAVS
ncbi:MAG: DUF433 domain-containing protein [Verrucomicrobia bacterium]|jgi:uncharacterized protein (DUF433 family)|nr:DUF433 domain-containing protein [Verrucomicrobiota bacterium]